MCWCLERSISIEMPGMLALGAVFLLFPLRSDGLASLQGIVCFYLLCIPINQLALQNVYIVGELHMSYSVPIVMLAAFGLFFSKPRSLSENLVVGPRASGFVTGKDGEAGDTAVYRRWSRTPTSRKTSRSKPDQILRQAPTLDVQQSVKTSWIMAVAIIAVHLMVLLWMLKEFYGYGYGHDLEVLGHIALYLLVFFMLWPQLGYLRCRQALGLVLVVFYMGMTIAGG